MRRKAEGYLLTYQLLRPFETIDQLLKITALYNVSAHDLVAERQRFGVTRCLHIQNRHPEKETGQGRLARS
jgi:hypothetical protein